MEDVVVCLRNEGGGFAVEVLSGAARGVWHFATEESERAWLMKLGEDVAELGGKLVVERGDEADVVGELVIGRSMYGGALVAEIGGKGRTWEFSSPSAAEEWAKEVREQKRVVDRGMRVLFGPPLPRDVAYRRVVRREPGLRQELAAAKWEIRRLEREKRELEVLKREVERIAARTGMSGSVVEQLERAVRAYWEFVGGQ